jgi:phosphohistidine swiveling domain-containing protein
MNDDSQWTFMLKRQLPPIVQSIYGNYLSMIYDKFMAIYKDGISYWFTTKNFFEAYDNEYIKRMKKREINVECNNAILLYEQAYSNVMDVLKEYKEKRELSDSQLLQLLYDDKFLKYFGNKYNYFKYFNNISTTELKEDITNLKTLFDNYGVIASYPPMIAGTALQEELIEKLAYIEFGKHYNELGDMEKLTIERHIGGLIWHEKLFESPYHNYEKDLLRTALAIKNKVVLNDVINNVIENIRDYIINDTDFLIEIGLDGALQKRIRERLRDIIRKNSKLIKFIKEYNWIGGVWKFGSKLDKNSKNIIVEKILQYIMCNKKLLEINLAEIEEIENICPRRRKKLIEELTREGKEYQVEFVSECLPYADIISTNQTTRFYRKCYLPMINEKIGNLMKDVATRLDLDNWEDIHYLTMNDILEGLKNRLIIENEELEKRKKAFLTIFENGKITTTITGEDAVESKINQLINNGRLDRKPWPDYDVKWDEKTPIKGTALNIPKGKIIEGNVFVQHTSQDLLKVKEGNIIVAPMIEPYHTVYMKDIGGIIVEDPARMSHAVVIARTRNIPIIVGAKDIIYAIFRYNVRKVAVKWNGEIQKVKGGEDNWATFV